MVPNAGQLIREALERYDKVNQEEKPDICRECKLPHGYACSDCELSQKVRLLEQAGDRIVKLVNEVYAMIGGPCILQDAVKEWERAKEEAE